MSELIDISKFMTELKATDHFRQAVIAEFPELEPDIKTYLVSGSSCACSARIKKAVIAALPKANKALKALGPNLALNPIHADIPKSTNVAGTMRTIPATTEAYSQLIKEMAQRQLVYKGLSVKDGPDSTWIIFFF